MTKDETMAEVRDAFCDRPRPGTFIRGTCSCDECLEHEETMQSFTPDNMSLDKLGNPGWDPICFASEEAFAYLMPGLVSLVLEHPDDYVQQFLFHLEDADRIAAFTRKQAQVLVRVLDHLTLECAEALDINRVVDELNRTREKLEQHAGGAC